MECRLPVIQLDDVHPSHEQDLFIVPGSVDRKVGDERNGSVVWVK